MTAQPDSTTRILLTELDEDVAELVPQYLANRLRELETLRNAIRSQDFSTIENIGHKLKGNAVIYGMEDLAELGASLEQAAKALDEPRVEVQIRSMESYLKGVSLV